jgi:hypothetical protein
MSLVPAAAAQHAEITYSMGIHPKAADVITVTMNIPQELQKKEFALQSTGIHLGIKPQFDTISCNDHTIVKPTPQGEWIIPSKTRKIRWDVKLIAKNPIHLNPAKQQSVLVKSKNTWMILSEFTFLLRVKNINYKSFIEFGPSLKNRITSEYIKDEEGKAILNPIDQAPVFFIIDLKPKIYKSSSNIVLNFFIDDESQKDNVDNLLSIHYNALKYLASLFPSKKAKNTYFNLVWIGLSDKERQISGSAGRNTIITNYIISDGKIVKDKLNWSLMVSSHEQFHILYSSAAKQPAWAQEGLAQYYSIKALNKVNPDSEEIKKIRKIFIKSPEKIELKLKAATHRFETQNDMSMYPLFYSLGSAVWNEIDSAISKSTSNRLSLDDFIGTISNLNFEKDGGLPNQFIEMLYENKIKGIDLIIDKYI